MGCGILVVAVGWLVVLVWLGPLCGPVARPTPFWIVLTWNVEWPGLTVAERVPIIAQRITADNYRYLQAKAERMNHELGARFLKAAEDAVPLGTALPWDKEASASPEKEGAAEEAVLPQDRPAVLYSNKPPFPVVAVNDLWLETCGFRREEVLGALPISRDPAFGREIVLFNFSI